MFMERNVSTQQKHWVIVRLLKSRGLTTLADFRLTNLLNTDYKILARLIAIRLRSMMAGLLQSIQFCGLPRNTIFDVVATVREAIAQADVKLKLLCVLSSYFQVFK